jgi:CrcB protein
MIAILRSDVILILDVWSERLRAPLACFVQCGKGGLPLPSNSRYGAMMHPLIPVMIGGATGAALRYLTSALMFRLLGPGYPWGTLTVNIIGGFAMGLLAGTLARFGPPSAGMGGEHWRLLLGVGVLGGFTTFSAFSLETYLMLERGEAIAAFGYIAVSVIGAVGALGLGLLTLRVLA